MTVARRSEAIRRRLGTIASLAAGAVAAAASVAGGVDRSAVERCCRCLSASLDDYGQPCVAESAAKCTERVVDEGRLEVNSRCLRDLCGTECGDLAGGITDRASIEECCSCLESTRDPSGAACLDTGADQCATAIDNGRAVRTTQSCLDEGCRSQCAFLGRSPADGGAGDGGA